MTEDQIKVLDDVSDRLGALYQRVGRWCLKEPDVARVLDEIVDLTEAVEGVSGRKKRESEN